MVGNSLSDIRRIKEKSRKAQSELNDCTCDKPLL
jgi:hypothetical protein